MWLSVVGLVVGIVLHISITALSEQETYPDRLLVAFELLLHCILHLFYLTCAAVAFVCLLDTVDRLIATSTPAMSELLSAVAQLIRCLAKRVDEEGAVCGCPARATGPDSESEAEAEAAAA